MCDGQFTMSQLFLLMAVCAIAASRIGEAVQQMIRAVGR
jgi:hypothetical protein